MDVGARNVEVADAHVGRLLGTCFSTNAQLVFSPGRGFAPLTGYFKSGETIRTIGPGASTSIGSVRDITLMTLIGANGEMVQYLIKEVSGGGSGTCTLTVAGHSLSRE
jgi:hypothetical protein